MNRELRTVCSLAALVISAAFAAGCVDSGDDVGRGGPTRAVEDMLGRKVDVPEYVDRVVGLGAGALRYLAYLDCVPMVVGVEDVEQDPGRPYTFAHPELTELPSIGPMHGGDAELIVAREPDVIFWAYTTVDDADELQQKTGVSVVALNYGDLGKNRDTAFEALRLMAGIMDRRDRAEELIDYVEGIVEDLEARTAGLADEDRPTCYVGGVGYMGVHGMLSTEPQYPPFLLVNAENAAGDLGLEHAFVDKEKLLEWDPDVLFVDQNGLYLTMEDMKDPVYDTLGAVKNGRLYGLPPYNWYSSNFGTVLADAYYIGKVLYPEQFEDVDPAKMADEIYVELLGEAVYDDVEAMFGGFGALEA